jgi:DoxX-like family
MNMQATGQTIAAPRTALSPTDLSIPRSKGIVVGFWIVTALFCLQIGFTAYAQLRLPQVAGAFTHLGFPDYFRVELSWAKLLGVVLLLAPVPARLKEWADAGFAITLGSALIAHLSVGDGPESGAGRRAPVCSGGFRTSSGAACRPRRRALRMRT